MNIPEKLTCIECPMSCALRLTREGDTIKVSGNQCRRGEEYALKEALHPRRVLTSTAATAFERFPRLPVRTAGEIPRKMLFAAMEKINALVVDKPALPGDVLIKNLLNTGVDLIATAETSGERLEARKTDRRREQTPRSSIPPRGEENCDETHLE